MKFDAVEEGIRLLESQEARRYPKGAIVIDENDPHYCHKNCPNKYYMGYFKGHVCEKFKKPIRKNKEKELKHGRCKECIEKTNINVD